MKPGGHTTPLLVLLCVISAGCSRGETPQIPPPASIGRIVSLSPSITRQIMDLGSGGKVVGVTAYSPVPGPGVKVVGSMLRPNAEIIAMLKPDIILVSREDSAVQFTEQLASLGIPVYEFNRNRDFNSLAENYLSLASILGMDVVAERKVRGYRERLNRIAGAVSLLKKRPVTAFFLSCAPLITASNRSFIGRIIADAGGDNCFGDVDIAYPKVSLESLIQRRPRVIFMLSGDMVSCLKSDLAAAGMKDTERVRWHVIPPDHITHYTPADYAASVEIMASLIGSGAER